MASWTVQSGGAIVATPNQSNQDGITSYTIPVDDSTVLQEIKGGSAYVLRSDSPVTVSLDPCSACTFLVLKVIGGYVDVGITPTIKPARSERTRYLYQRCEDDPITAITLTRPPATEVTVHVFVGQRTSS